MIAAPCYPPAGTLRLGLASWSTRANLALYRRSNGRLGGRFLGMPKLRLDHIGPRSGSSRTRPLNYVQHGARFAVVGSRGGLDITPAWWLNLQASTQTTIQVGDRRITAAAQEATPPSASGFGRCCSRPTRATPFTSGEPAVSCRSSCSP
jgi:deazaflavin-dependent oxidoreductase (nitroreductase family)